MKKVKAIVSLAVAVVLSLSSVALAYDFPKSYWKIHTNYENAVAANNHSDIIKYGTEAINLMLKEPQNEDNVVSLIADRAKKVAESYAALGMYDESAEMYEFFIPYGQKKGWKDSVIIAESDILQYKTKVQLYTDGGDSVYYAAKNEPLTGMYYGTIVNTTTRDVLQNESAVLVYHELGQEKEYYVDDILKEAQEQGLVVEFALNCPGQGYDIANFESKKYDIQNISKIFKQFPDVKILLRFGAEFNVWANIPDAEQFKSAFRYVSKYMKENNTNVAMVWSPNYVSQWGDDMDKFYPGDEYVDWVGVSLYMTKYFLGNPNSPHYEESFFKTGVNSDPILMMDEVIKKYGDRKPIMISESGAGHHVISSFVDEDTTDWAVEKIKQYLAYLPMVYPQIKFMAYFDIYIPGESNDFALVDNQKVLNQFMESVKSTRFIKAGNENATMTYRPLYNHINVDGILPVSCYAHMYNETVSSVSYYIDGVQSEVSSQLPYTVYLNLSNVAPAAHTIKAVVTTISGKTAECEYIVDVSAQNTVGVYVSGNKINFDQAPIIHNDRTMVPLRAIFEALGAEVEWDAPTRTVVSKKGNTTVSMTIDSDTLYKNGLPIYLDVPAMLVGDRTLVPVRAVSEALGAKVDWDEATQSVIITE